jgi:CMP-N,N'-diacetyllegionaminic acid synthase
VVLIGSRNVLGIIPARGGSKGLPRKNIVDLGGKPLIAWTILAAQESAYIDRLIVSTDDQEIADAARKWNCDVPFIRPDELAGDDASSVDVVIHALQTLDTDHDYVVLLQPTSPFRTGADIDGCLEQCEQSNAPVCVSICNVDKSPYWMVSKDEQNNLRNILETPVPVSRRQDLPEVYALNGAVYAAEVDWIRANKAFLMENTLGYVMPRERSLDIDTEFDLSLAKNRISGLATR